MSSTISFSAITNYKHPLINNIRIMDENNIVHCIDRDTTEYDYYPKTGVMNVTFRNIYVYDPDPDREDKRFSKSYNDASSIIERPYKIVGVEIEDDADRIVNEETGMDYEFKLVEEGTYTYDMTVKLTVEIHAGEELEASLIADDVMEDIENSVDFDAEKLNWCSIKTFYTHYELKKNVKQYAERLLYEAGCDEYTYGGDYVKHIVDDLKEYQKNHVLPYPLIDVANAILEISKPKPIERAPYRVVWDTDHCTDGYDCESFDAAKNSALDTLCEWAAQEMSTWKNDKPTEKEIENWDYMIYNSGVSVHKYNPWTDEYDEYWSPSDEDEKKIGWMEWEELQKSMTEEKE